MWLLSAGDFLDRCFREVRVGEPFPGSFAVLAVEYLAGVNDGAAPGFRVLNVRGPFYSDGGVVVDDAGGVSVGGGIAVGGGREAMAAAAFSGLRPAHTWKEEPTA